MKPIIFEGWTIFFHPLFYEQWLALVERVKRLKVKLKEEDFIVHPDVKLLKALDTAIKEKIPPRSFCFLFRSIRSARKIRSSQTNGVAKPLPSIF